MIPRRIAYLGPPGTFSEEALLSQPDLAEADLLDVATFPEILLAVSDGTVDGGFVAIENAIEGSVNVNLDALVFEHDLFIQREVVHAIHQHLLAPPGTRVEAITHVVSFPVALGQCRAFFRDRLPGVVEVAAASTSDAARLVAAGLAGDGVFAAVGTALAAKLYDLDVIAPDIDDHRGNATRFVLVARREAGIPPRTGHDKTSIACFQHADAPGSLHAILGEFSARAINLTRLESRPTKLELGQYCFIIDLDGHIADPVVAHCLRDLHASLANIKLLGSYPAAGAAAAERRAEVGVAVAAADAWIDVLQQAVRP